MGLTSVYPGKLGPSSVMKMGRSRDSERSQGSGFHKWWKAIPKIKPNRPRMGAHPRQRTTFICTLLRESAYPQSDT